MARDDDRSERLDILYKQYLKELDKYDKAQKEITSLYNAGIFALAGANFRNTTRLRYGSDRYDGRMKALRRFTVQEDERGQMVVGKEGDDYKETSMNGAEGDEHGTVISSDSEGMEGSTSLKGDKPITRAPNDPLKWFGILVPPELRTCQNKFIHLIGDTVINATNAACQLRRLETEIAMAQSSVKP